MVTLAFQSAWGVVVVVGIRKGKGRGRKCLTDSRKDSEQIQKETVQSFRLVVTSVCVFFYFSQFPWHFLGPSLCALHVFSFASSPIHPPPPHHTDVVI